MYFYFHIQFKNNTDIYIVRVENRATTLLVAERHAKRIITSAISNIEEDFEINRVVIPNSLVAQFVFIDDIAQLISVTHP